MQEESDQSSSKTPNNGSGISGSDVPPKEMETQLLYFDWYQTFESLQNTLYKYMLESGNIR